VGSRPLPLGYGGSDLAPVRGFVKFRQSSDETRAVGAPPPATPGRTFSPCPYWDTMRMVLYTYGSCSMDCMICNVRVIAQCVGYLQLTPRVLTNEAM